VFALEALRVAGVDPQDPAIGRALRFVKRCQSFGGDGGFHFMHGDVVRNKAGVIDRGPSQAPRFASYGSATADGLRALRHCGLGADDARCKAALVWMARHFSADRHPGDYQRDREHLRPALYYYWCASAAKALRSLSIRHLPRDGQSIDWAAEMAAALISRQHSDGSWRNAAVDNREDDPIVATSLAMGALAHCRKMLLKGA
jgi:squalene-hopene/tetraprenyl-beta-curcumene cyclase